MRSLLRNGDWASCYARQMLIWCAVAPCVKMNMELGQRIECVINLYPSNNIVARPSPLGLTTGLHTNFELIPLVPQQSIVWLKDSKILDQSLTYQNLGDSVFLRIKKDEVSETLQHLQEDNLIGVASTAQVSAANGIPKRSVCRIPHKELQFYPYKLQLTQMMSEDDHLKRVQYAQFFFNRIDILDSHADR